MSTSTWMEAMIGDSNSTNIDASIAFVGESSSPNSTGVPTNASASVATSIVGTTDADGSSSSPSSANTTVGVTNDTEVDVGVDGYASVLPTNRPPATDGSYNSRIAPCPGYAGSGLKGYTTLTSLVEDIRDYHACVDVASCLASQGTLAPAAVPEVIVSDTTAPPALTGSLAPAAYQGTMPPQNATGDGVLGTLTPPAIAGTNSSPFVAGTTASLAVAVTLAPQTANGDGLVGTTTMPVIEGTTASPVIAATTAPPVVAGTTAPPVASSLGNTLDAFANDRRLRQRRAQGLSLSFTVSNSTEASNATITFNVTDPTSALPTAASAHGKPPLV